MNEPKYKIHVKQKVLFKKNEFFIEIYDEIAKLTYLRNKSAKETYDAMVKQKPDIELKGNILFDYYDGETAKQIYYKYIQDLEKSATNKSKFMSIKYEVLKGG